MREKLLLAAIITFSLHLAAGMGFSVKIQGINFSRSLQAPIEKADSGLSYSAIGFLNKASSANTSVQ